MSYDNVSGRATGKALAELRAHDKTCPDCLSLSKCSARGKLYLAVRKASAANAEFTHFGLTNRAQRLRKAGVK